MKQSMLSTRYFVATDCGCNYACVIDAYRYNALSWWARWWNPTQAAIYGGTRYECHLITNDLNSRKEFLM